MQVAIRQGKRHLPFFPPVFILLPPNLWDLEGYTREIREQEIAKNHHTTCPIRGPQAAGEKGEGWTGCDNEPVVYITLHQILKKYIYSLNYSKWHYKNFSFSTGITLQDPQWTLETENSTEPYIHYVFCYTGIPMVRFHLQAQWENISNASTATLGALVLSRFSHVQLFATQWTVARQASLSMEFSRQEYWSGLSCPPQRIFPRQGSNPCALGPLLNESYLNTSTTVPQQSIW